MDIGARVKQLRESQHMTHYQLYKLTGIPLSHIKNIEETGIKPRFDTICLLAEGLGCSLPEFFNEDHSTYYLNEDEKNLISVYRHLKPVQKPLIKIFADALDNANNKR